MNFIDAVILGIIQGLTEFLPISSTGHVTLYGKFFGLIDSAHSERWTSFIAVIQMGTLLAVLVYFRKDIYNITAAFFTENLIDRKKISEQSANSRMGWNIIVGTIPVVIIGLSFKDIIEGALTKNLYLIAGSLIVLGIILAVAEKLGTFKKEVDEIKWYHSFIIGIAQSFALIPGSSRSGTTITAGLFTGLKREAAARFSFLLGIPAILASGLLQFYESLSYMDKEGIIILILSTLASAVSGYLTIAFLLNYLKKHTTFVFVYYRIILGGIILILLSFDIIIL